MIWIGAFLGAPLWFFLGVITMGAVRSGKADDEKWQEGTEKWGGDE